MIKLLKSFLLLSEPRATATNSPTPCKLQITWTSHRESVITTYFSIHHYFSAIESSSIWTNVVKTRRATATVRARGGRARRSAACSAASSGSCASPSAAPWPTPAGAPAPRGPGELWLVSWPQYSPLIGPQHHDPGAQHLLLRRGLHHGGLQVLQGGDQLSQLPPGGVPQ